MDNISPSGAQILAGLRIYKACKINTPRMNHPFTRIDEPGGLQVTLSTCGCQWGEEPQQVMTIVLSPAQAGCDSSAQW